MQCMFDKPLTKIFLYPFGKVTALLLMKHSVEEIMYM